MKISENDVERLAMMSRLDLTAEDKEVYMKSLNAALESLDIVQEPDTSLVQPAAHVLPVRNVFREDTLQPSLDKDLVLANAPEAEAGLFKVPRIL